MRPRRMEKKKKKTDTKSTIMSVSELSVNVPEAKERTLSWFLTSAKQSGGERGRKRGKIAQKGDPDVTIV